MPTDYTTSDSHSAWKGKAIEQLVAAHCVLGSRGRLNVSYPMVDDAGVDFVFHLRDQPATLAVQVKSRFSSSSYARRGVFATDVRRATFHPREDFALLFVFYDTGRHEISDAWLVPSRSFEQQTENQVTTRPILRIALSLAGKANQWLPFRCSRSELPVRLMAMLE